ncbi:hypothetical protein DERF_009929 [Dermatophagoides farinae]|uniref:Uncharacterized protein n=1 Tax=Dermatophagoides farinae TaxID=6954 RepID=A0A922HXK5_DERFA|nr:hypothetical protein DERF_009929 [Dermatophagoides farinae]
MRREKSETDKQTKFKVTPAPMESTPLLLFGIPKLVLASGTHVHMVPKTNERTNQQTRTITTSTKTQ